MSDAPVFLEPTARAIAQENFERYAPWLLGDDLSELQRRERLLEVFANIAHDGLLTRAGLLELTSQEDKIGELVMHAEVLGYINALNDTDEGQGEK